MTEDEAKTKWCPFVRVFETKDGEQWNNRPDSGFSSDAYCIGSACMAWRRTGVAKVENRQGKLVDRDIDGTGRWHYDGFCGLAGKP